MRTFCIFIISIFLLSGLHAQVIDVQHYNFELHLSDASDTLKGTATISMRFLKTSNRCYLNLASVANGTGMQVYRVAAQDTSFSFTHAHDTLAITFSDSIQQGAVQGVTIIYAGIPADGLIISKNRWRNRTFFADNWPNRAHQWLPCNDRPDDKATVAFSVIAPSQYRIISNGVLQEETPLPNNQTRTRWQEAVPIPTKVMVIGAARFAVKNYPDSSVVPVSAWVYPQDSAKGFYDYALAPEILSFFNTYIGAYPFEKLANVQSKTVFGGMENASCIFYAENSVTGTRKSEDLLAHEIAHQWFGNSATEQSFAHLWLSEGFATYLAHLYLARKYGHAILVKRLHDDRKEIIQFAKQWPNPVVDSLSALMDLLNANSYQKGSWVLHMLRQEVDDTVFQNIIRTYYDRYKYSNADTWAFEKVAEAVSGKDLNTFFKQWLFTPGVPQLQVQWQWKKGQLFITVRQQQPQPFAFSLTIGMYRNSKKFTERQLAITNAVETFTLPAPQKPVRVVLDPDTNLLFEGTITETK